MMININCYREKCALIAYYFCGKEKKSINEKTVFEMWNSGGRMTTEKKDNLYIK